jgi:hypothetical protein
MYVLLYCGVSTGVRLLPPGENPIAVRNNNNNNNNNYYYLCITTNQLRTLMGIPDDDLTRSKHVGEKINKCVVVVTSSRVACWHTLIN